MVYFKISNPFFRNRSLLEIIANSDFQRGLEFGSIKNLHLSEVRNPSETSIKVPFSDDFEW